MAINPWVFYGCCRGCNRTPTIVGKLDSLGYCATCNLRRTPANDKPAPGKETR